MTTLTIRKLDDRVKERLRIAAATRGHSMEEEARQILARALMQDDTSIGLATAMREIFRGVDLDGFEIAERVGTMRDPFA